MTTGCHGKAPILDPVAEIVWLCGHGQHRLVVFVLHLHKDPLRGDIEVLDELVIEDGRVGVRSFPDNS